MGYQNDDPVVFISFFLQVRLQDLFLCLQSFYKQHLVFVHLLSNFFRMIIIRLETGLEV
jgi:hypothetical protein